MKKMISLIMAIMMCLSLCACGSGNGGSSLTKNAWNDIGDSNISLTFKSNGTGTFKGMDMTWTQADQKISISYQGAMRTMTVDFNVVETENLTMLIECPNDIAGAWILVSADNYEESCQKAKDYLIEQAIDLEWDTVYHEMLENSAKAAATYTGKVVKWTAKVYEIFNNSCQMATRQSGSSPVNPIYVYMAESELIKFNKFDVITVIGILDLGDYYADIDGAIVLEVK